MNPNPVEQEGEEKRRLLKFLLKIKKYLNYKLLVHTPVSETPPIPAPKCGRGRPRKTDSNNTISKPKPKTKLTVSQSRKDLNIQTQPNDGRVSSAKDLSTYFVEKV